MKAKKTSLPLKFRTGLKHWKSKFSILILLLLLLYLLAGQFRPLTPQVAKNQQLPEYLACPFSQTVYEKIKENSLAKIQAKAIIVPHHLLARDLIIQTLEQVKNDYETVILVGPNHQNSGQADIQTSRAIWKTQFGDLEPDEKLINNLTKNGVVQLEESHFAQEHSICGLVSFIKIYFSRAKIVPLILKNNTTQTQAKNLGRKLAENCSNCLLIASVDFSHDVSATQATKNDSQSAKIITDLNEKRLGQVVCDSQPTLQTLFSFLESKGAKRLNLVNQSNSAEISSQDFSTVTSYLTFTFE